ncbi:hypothetical protein [Streptomyces sp. NPDC056194]|uniref:hypothetical protein n=1 Tax=unclassified Streptomyces TaxID=2593676 RepID=UPI0035E2602E
MLDVAVRLRFGAGSPLSFAALFAEATHRRPTERAEDDNEPEYQLRSRFRSLF